MIRSGFKPKRPPARPATQWQGDTLPGPRSPALSSSSEPARAIVQVPKDAPVRAESYRRFVANFPCFDCGIRGWSQCAHENFGKGMGLKVCDTRTFPLCAPRFGLLGCHLEFDLGLGLTRDERREQGRVWVERMQALALIAGRPEIKP